MSAKNKTWGILVDDNRNGYFCDNEIVGPEPSVDRDRAGYGPSYNFELGGTGNVICHNTISHFWDLITSSDACYSAPVCLANDIQDNLLLYATDDAVELDGSLRNVRFLRNRIGSSFTGISVQPAYGGPVYVMRNEVFSMQRGSLKLNPAYSGQDGASGVVVLHNTFVNFDRPSHGGTWSNGYFRNNILYATQSYVVNDSIQAGTDLGFDFDYDSVHFTGTYAFNLTFLTPNPDVTVRYRLADLCTRTGSECNGKVFASRTSEWVNAPEPTAGAGAATVVFEPGDWDLTLAEGASSIDSAVALPNVNDNFAGEKPDRGALEKGLPIPIYGPRDPVAQLPDGGVPGGGEAGAESPVADTASNGESGCACSAPPRGDASLRGALLATLAFVLARVRRRHRLKTRGRGSSRDRDRASRAP